jgi:hypothetical protein
MADRKSQIANHKSQMVSFPLIHRHRTCRGVQVFADPQFLAHIVPCRQLAIYNVHAVIWTDPASSPRMVVAGRFVYVLQTANGKLQTADGNPRFTICQCAIDFPGGTL